MGQVESVFTESVEEDSYLRQSISIREEHARQIAPMVKARESQSRSHANEISRTNSPSSSQRRYSRAHDFLDPDSVPIAVLMLEVLKKGESLRVIQREGHVFYFRNQALDQEWYDLDDIAEALALNQYQALRNSILHDVDAAARGVPSSYH